MTATLGSGASRQTPALGLSTVEAAARLTWIVVPGTSLDRDSATLLARGAGGVVLFARNIETPDQVRHLAAEIRAAASASVRIAVDQEGGHIVRLGAPLTRFPSAMAVGATRSPGLAYRVAYASALELASVGIDVALAPVLDVAADGRNPVIGSRSFGSDPRLVGLLGAAAVRGYLDGGVIPTPKHFPGHGRTPLDSHVDCPVVRGGIHALAELDLPPFQAAVAAGAPVVMVGHVAYEGLTHGRPATLSPEVMRTLLRDRLGFQGTVLTDAMVMDAVADGRSVPDACVEALRSGADVVMPLEPQRRAIAEIERAIRRGTLDETAIARSIDRLGALDRIVRRHPSRLLGATPGDVPDEEPRRTAGNGPAFEGANGGPFTESRSAAHGALAAEIARRSLTLVHGSWQGPLGPAERVLIVEFAASSASPIDEGVAESRSLASVLAARLPCATSVVVEPGRDRLLAEARAISLSRSVETIVVATRDGALDRPAQMLVAAIAASARRIVHVALRSPEDVAMIASDLAIAAYSDVPASLDAVADALTLDGPAIRDRFPGALPMRLEPEGTARTFGYSALRSS